MCNDRPRRSFHLAILVLGLVAAAGLSGPDAQAQWVEFVNETSTRLVAQGQYGVSDVDEKDYAWGDVDQDGDIDLVVVRKQPFTTPGKRVNRLFMNENGVLVDRTDQFAVASDIPGDQGFNTPTNNRDVVLVDVDLDGWLDIITATTLSDGDPYYISHPRMYRNLRNSELGAWLGFRYEAGRIPILLNNSGQNGAPRFCSVAAGDVTGDGYPDLWFGDYDSSGVGGGSPEPPGADFDDRLLINTGTGKFTDATQTRFQGQISIPGTGSEDFEVSAFGAAGAIADMNGDGLRDIVKQTSLNDPLYVGVAYNQSVQQGFFSSYDVVNNQSPYFVSTGDLNNDARLDLVITDDGADRYMLNQGNGTDGMANFLSFPFSFDQAGDDGFGSQNIIADLNNDGWNDVLIADVDVDIEGCGRRMHIYRNLGGQPGGNVTLQEQTSGTGCAGSPATCQVASIPADKLRGVFNVAVFDINGDNWLDLVIGRCSGTEVWINQPPVGLVFSYPQGLPFFVPPGQPYTFQVQVTGFGGAQPAPGSGRLYVSIAGGAFQQSTMTNLGGGLYEATIPAGTDCADSIDFYVSADAVGGGTTFDPETAPASSFHAVAAIGTEVLFEDGAEGSVSGWTVVNNPGLTSGAWQVAAPNGTVAGNGEQAAPDEDAEASTSLINAWVTQNGSPGGAVGTADVDGGPTDLITPVLDLAGTSGVITYSRWFYTDGSDTLEVAVTNNGTTWVPVETVSGADHNAWEVGSFTVGDFVTPTSTVRVRFRTSDSPNNSITEAGLDRLRVETLVCAGCQGNPECDDGVFCNGAETCSGGTCSAGIAPCAGQFCDEASDACVECFDDPHCDDGVFCNGAETCNAGHACQPGGDPCPGEQCNEDADACVECLGDPDCDDGVFCNGTETCNAGTCFQPGEGCPGRLCDEDNDSCVGAVALQPRMGQPLLGLSAAERARFDAGRAAFDRTLTIPEGLGPGFNQDSCGSCHNTRLGGSGTITVTRFGFNDDKGGGFDPLASLGGSLLQAEAISPECLEQVPPEANITALRLTNSTLGFGLVEAIPDADIAAGASNPPPLVSGRVHMVPLLENPPETAVGRFGWKAQLATVLSFSGDAALNEMGLTNRLVPQENDPNGTNPPTVAECDTVPDPEDGPDGDGLHFIDRVTDFQRFLAPPPQTPRSGMTGEALFNTIGCASCHASAFITPNDPALEPALRVKLLRPFSDFLLHDMGQSADFIVQGGAQGRELRSAPLWGLRVRDPLWHDGRVAGGTFTNRVTAAIALHDVLGSEARPAAQAFAALALVDKTAVVAFLDSLGKAEFDNDGDGDIDSADYAAFEACRNGPQGYDPDDPCAVSDVDQDGDVDDDDFESFLAATDGRAGAVPNNDPLVVTHNPGTGELTLDWSPSCVGSDDDYAVYEGSLGNFTGHQPVVCGTGGTTSATFLPGAGGRFYLVVPSNGLREGSYGLDSLGDERPASSAACLPQASGACQ